MDERVFVSSLASGSMVEIRRAAIEGVRAVRAWPVAFEDVGAAPESSRRALLDRLAGCDALLLLVGAEYGQRTASGVSATEEEFQEAVRRGIPVLALVQRVARDQDERDFLERVRGSWDRGRFAPDFEGPDDVTAAVVRAITDWRGAAPAAELRGQAAARAVELAGNGGRHGQSHTGAVARLVMVPVLDLPLLDAVALADDALADRLATAARAAGLATNDAAIRSTVAGDGVELKIEAAGRWEKPCLAIHREGAVVAEGAVSADGLMGSSIVLAPRVETVIRQSAAFAQAVWAEIDTGDRVRSVCTALAIPDASQKAFAAEQPAGSTISMGTMSGPAVLVAPDDPLVIRREDLGCESVTRQLLAELRQQFTDRGSIAR